jgi:drug/metabolite transporter (DMT)-like permease
VNPAHGTLLALAAFGAMSWGDALVKAVGGRMTIFEIGIFFLLAAGCATYFMRPADERWRDMFRMRHPWLTLARAVTGFGSGMFGFFAFTTIPFAEAYALIFLAPFIVMLLSFTLLQERASMLGWATMAAGIVGVLLVIKPGFRTVELGHLSALAAAAFVASTVIILRRIAGDEKLTSLLGVPMLFGGTLSLLLALPGFTWPSLTDVMIVAAGGLLGGMGQFFLLHASRRAPAGAVGQAQYSQLIWAVLIGALFYSEFPDWIAISGLALIAAAGLANIAASRLTKGQT